MRWLVLAAVLAGCTPYVSVTTATVSGPIIRVEAVRRGEVAVGADRLDAAEARAIAARIDEAARGAPAAVEVVLFGGSEPMRRDIAAIASRSGVPGRNVSRAPGRSGSDNRVVVTRWVAVPPECRERVVVGAPVAPFGAAGLGCAALVELALAVADPRDLLGRPGVVLVDERPEWTRGRGRGPTVVVVPSTE